MVKKILFIFIVFPIFLFSAEFTASVNKKQVGMDESFALHLTLKDAATQGAPSIASLQNSFHIRSQQQSSSTMMMNGRSSMNNTWTIILQPKQEGEILIPSISINTNQGVLSTNPITIKITKESASVKSSESDDIDLITEVSTNHPFKNETFFFTIILKSKIDLANVQMPRFSIEDAIIEQNGEPRLDRKIIDGIKHNVATFNYLVTPLTAGTLNIPSITLEGSIPMKRRPQTNSFFDYDLDPLFLMSGFDRLQPFIKSSAPITLIVKPAVAGITPWLPAHNITIEEFWDPSQHLEVGEPIARSIKINAEGILASQLPDLTERQSKNNQLKVYSDKPAMGNDIKDNIIYSYRLEQYTLIPQQSGSLTLPEIALEWWDVENNKKGVAVLPSRNIEIMPKIDSVISMSSSLSTQDVSDQTVLNITAQRDPLLYGLIAILSLLLAAAMIWIALLQMKISRMKSPTKAVKPVSLKPKEIPKPKDTKEKLPDLNPT